MIKSNPFTYRAYIDGLRALAVIPVVFFHADFSFFKGGFVGVDIFFVISGFLITSIILKEKKNSKFSLIKFYLRRIRRIIPALFLITIFTIPFSIYLMSPNDLKIYSQSVFAVIFFISNFFFWGQGGYFGQESELTPLLHTWSLGVEEQFYIFFPIFLIFMWKIQKKLLVPTIILGLIISLISSQIGGNFKHINLLFEYPYFKLPFEWFWQAGMANFYLPFGRIWELMIGSLIAFYFEKHRIKESFLNNIYSLAGLILIIFSIIFFSENVQYPSIFTLLPAIGTALIIIFATNNTYLNKILSNKILVNIGLVSFSFYLWHQPLLAFSRIYLVSNLSLFVSIFLITLSLIFSYLSWKYVEKPFRDKNKISDKKLTLYFLFSFLFIFLFAALMYFQKININKTILPDKILKTLKAQETGNCFDIEFAHLPSKKDWYCEIGDQNKDISFAVLGDSHALSLKTVLDQAAKEKNLKGLFTGFSGCIPFLNVYAIRQDQAEFNCNQLNKKFFQYVEKNKISKIFLVAKWTYYTDGNYDSTNISHISKYNKLVSNKRNSRNAFEFGLKNTVEKYNKIGVEIIFIHQAPLQIFTPDYIYLHSIKKNKNNYTKSLYNLSVEYNEHKSFQKFVTNKVNSIKKDRYFHQLNPDIFLCDKKKCIIGSQDGSYYIDNNHLSDFGSMKLKNEIKKFLK